MNNSFYINARKKFFKNVKEDSLTVLFSGNVIQKSGDQDYPFEVNKNFYYLTGINQADVVLVLLKANDECKEFLFIEENDEVLSKWVGRKLTKEESREISGINEVYYYDDLDLKIFSLLNPSRKNSYHISTLNLDLERRDLRNYTSPALIFSRRMHKDYPALKIENIYDVLIAQRMVKTKEEVELIKESIKTTKTGLENIMRNLKPGMYEYQVETLFDAAIKSDGNKDHSFTTICASGKNATILHYVKNDNIVKDKELLLLDLGCRTNFYVSDISRTYPVNGKFTERQKEIYNIVLETNKKCISFLKPGITWNEYNRYANQLLISGLKKINLIKKDEELINFYWHSIGHSTGLDTHDPTPSKLPLCEGMVLTVEPGLYLENEGIGIRIEDNVLLTKDGCINLSKDIIKEIDDIEAFMAKNK